MTDLDAMAREILRRNRRGRRGGHRRGGAAAVGPSIPSTPTGTPGSGRAWVEVSARSRCPVCEGDTWCQIARDGETVLCKRVESGRARVNRNGEEFHVHHLGDLAGAFPRCARGPRPAPLQPTRAPVEACDAAYRAILDALPLDAGDAAALLARGLTEGDIARNGYRSLAVEGRARLARAVVAAVGEDLARGVPGVVQRTEGERGWLSLAGAPGVLIPCRDGEGRIVALKVRRRDPVEGPRYLYLTSAKAGGASAPSVLHVPGLAREILDAAPGGPARLVVTEGELKADVSTALLDTPVVSLPGVGSWRLALDAAARWRPREVCVALDMDSTHNAHVARAASHLVDALRDAGHRTALWRWDGRFKGLDDYLAARRRGEVTA